MNRNVVLIVAGFIWVSLGASAQPIDFKNDIQPIFESHCIKCHRPERAEAKLSLHRYEAALRGGRSGKPIMGGTVETNEILRRVKSKDVNVRMPLEMPALSEDEIDRLTRWVEQGTPWPKGVEQSEASSLEVATGFIKRWVTPYLPWLIGILIVVAVLERGKALRKRRAATTEGRERSRWDLLERVGPAFYLSLLLCLALGVMVDRYRSVKSELAFVKERREVYTDEPTFESVFGIPPVPIRPSHSPRLGGIYYRGNSERNKALYNNGYYLTAIFDLALVDEQGNQLAYGSEIRGDVKVQLKIRRATGATPVLFKEDIMSGLLLTTGYDSSGLTVYVGEAAMFTPTEETDEWQAQFDLPELSEDRTGLVYLYRGEYDEGRGYITTTGIPHVGIVYDLKIKEGRIAEGSELWMDGIYYSEEIALPVRKNRIPWTEWYDYRPMPLIQGEQTDDPDLLGISEYVEENIAPEQGDVEED